MENNEINIYKKTSKDNNNEDIINSNNKRSKIENILNKNNYENKNFENSNNSIDFDIDKVIYQFKVVLVGDINVGKTSILNKYINKRFSKEHRATISIEFKIKTIKINSTTICDLKIWDTCGDEKYFSITKNYFRDSQGIILVYDITSKKSFLDLSKWLDLIKQIEGNSNIILVGNKNDLKNQREVSLNEANKFALKNGLKNYEISAKEDFDEIDKIFFDLSNDLIKNENKENNNSLDISNNNNNTFSLNKKEEDNNFLKVNNEQKKSCC
jgi:small GTP-binding protein